MNAIHALATTLSTGTPQTAAGLTLVPLLRRTPAKLAHLGFAEALKLGLVEVTELGPGGSVPEVSVLNRGELPILFLDGEALVGAKQNRVLNLSVLVPGKATTTIPVSCVEAGRWSPRSRAFVDGESLHFAKARACKVANVSEAMAQGMGRRSNQGDVWATMDDYLADFDAAAPSRAMQDGYAKVQHTVDDLLGSCPRWTGRPAQHSCSTASCSASTSWAAPRPSRKSTPRSCAATPSRPCAAGPAHRAIRVPLLLAVLRTKLPRNPCARPWASWPPHRGSNIPRSD